MQADSAVLFDLVFGSDVYAVMGIDREQRIVAFNPGAERIFGYSAEEIAGQPLEWLIPEGSWSRHRRYVEAFLQESGPDCEIRWMSERSEIQGRRKDGSCFPAIASIGCRRTGSGQLVGVAILSDLTTVWSPVTRLKLFQELLECTPDFVGVACPDGSVIYHNRGAKVLLGYAPEDLQGPQDPVASLLANQPDWANQKLREEGLPSAQKHGWWRGETAFLDTRSEEIPVDQILVAHRGASGEVERYSTIARDMRPHRVTENELRTRAQALEQTADLVWITDPQGHIEYVNSAFEMATGFSQEEAVGKQVGDLLGSDGHSPTFHQELKLFLESGEPFRAVFRHRTRAGELIDLEETITPIHDCKGNLINIVATARDATERRRQEKELRDLAHFDQLTGLPNRTLFEDRVDQAIARAKRSGEHLALLFLDLDHFKDINDNLGHAFGDKMLKAWTERLVRILRGQDTLARYGGDEVVVLLEGLGHPREAETIAQRALAATQEPLSVEGQELEVEVSIGVALYPDSGLTASQLIQQADTAMYRAKQVGRSAFRLFSPEQDTRAQQQLELTRDFRQALQDERFEVHFQPIVELATGRETGLEALARWYHPERGWIPPTTFIRLAERIGATPDLGRLILDKALAGFHRFRAQGPTEARLAVNLSPRQLDDAELLDTVQVLARRYGIPSERIEFEITEETFLRKGQKSLGRLKAFREEGFGLAIDDFGTGYSSLQYLMDLPTDRIKIASQFVQGLPEHPGSQGIVRAIVALASSFQVALVGEGVETPEQEAFLKGWSIQEGQGFFYAKPRLVTDWLSE